MQVEAFAYYALEEIQTSHFYNFGSIFLNSYAFKIRFVSYVSAYDKTRPILNVLSLTA